MGKLCIVDPGFAEMMITAIYSLQLCYFVCATMSSRKNFIHLPQYDSLLICCVCSDITSDHSEDFIGNGPVLVKHCLMNNQLYLQLCI